MPAGDLPAYITRFQWDMAKYPIKQSLRNIADIISKQVAQIDADLKTKSTAYNNLKGNLQNLEKKQTLVVTSGHFHDLATVPLSVVYKHHLRNFPHLKFCTCVTSIFTYKILWFIFSINCHVIEGVVRGVQWFFEANDITVLKIYCLITHVLLQQYHHPTISHLMFITPTVDAVSQNNQTNKTLCCNDFLMLSQTLCI
jgi:hypothetical protein